MATSSHVRVISLILSISVLVGVGVMLEYTSKTTVPKTDSPTEPERATTSPPDQIQSPAVSPKVTPERQPVVSTTPHQMFKCERNGRISFNDHPCAVSEKTLAITSAAPISPPIQQETDLQRMQRQLSRMEAERHQREQQFDQDMAARRQPVTVVPDKTIRCAQIDKEISHIDSLLRQPHTAQWGDYWAEQRKKLYDERFDLHC